MIFKHKFFSKRNFDENSHLKEVRKFTNKIIYTYFNFFLLFLKVLQTNNDNPYFKTY